MRKVIPTALLSCLLNATPAQYAAVHRVFGLEMEPGEQAENGEAEEGSEDLARKLFALVNALESETNYRKAPVIRVFYLFCVRTRTREEVARACRCVPSLVTLRLQAIEKNLGRKPRELRSFSSEFERISDSLSDSRARFIDRQRALGGSEPDEDE